MLEKLRIQNFKSWQDTGDIAFGSLTGFFGTNSSGKSSILQFLLMLKQTVESFDRSRILNFGDSTSYVHLGTMQDVLYQRKNTGEIIFCISWTLPKSAYPANYAFMQQYRPKIQSLQFEAGIKADSDSILVDYFTYSTEGTTIGIKHDAKAPSPAKPYRMLFKNRESKYQTVGDDFFSSKPKRFYGFPVETDLYTTTIDHKRELEAGVEKLFSEIFYLGPLREFPSRIYLWGGEDSEGIGNRGERAVAALLSSRNQGPTIDMGADQPKRTVEEHVAHWLKELGLIYSFKVQPIAPNRKEYEVRIQRTAESASVFLTDVGFGVSQILPVLVLLFYVPEGSTVILEQPEIHLHPAVQAGLADVFIDAIKRRKLQIVLESHSEHLLQRLQRRMAEEVITPDTIKLYFTSIKQGRSELTTLDLDEYGNIRNWPEGFFGDTLGEAAAMMKAEMARRMREPQA